MMTVKLPIELVDLCVNPLITIALSSPLHSVSLSLNLSNILVCNGQ